MAILAQDSFNRANSTTTLGNTQTGQTWQAYVSSTTLRWGIQSNRAYPNRVVYDAPTFIDVGQSDNLAYQITHAVFHITSQVMWRITSNNNYFLAEGDAVYRNISGTFVEMGKIGTVASGSIIRIELRGSNHKVFVNGQERLSFNDSNHLTGTRFGFGTNNTATRYDDFLVETVAPLDTTPPEEVSNLSETHTHNAVTLNWTNPADADFSHVRILRNGTVLAGNHTGTTFTDTGLTQNTSYVYLIKTVDSTGNESAGVSITAQTGSLDNTPPTPLIIGLSRSKISDEQGLSSAILRFRFNEPIVEWRLMVNGVSHDTGTLVDEGVGNIPAGTEISAVIEWTELYQEGVNRINLYGRDASGNWTPHMGGQLIDGKSFLTLPYERVFNTGTFTTSGTGHDFDGGEWTF